MTEAIKIFLAGSFQHDTTSVFKASKGAGALTDVTVPQAWYRVWLAPTGGGGTAHTDPFEYLAKLQALTIAAVGTGFVFRMGSDGRVQVTNTLDSYAFTWDGTGGTDKKARNVLGFTANISSTPAGTYTTATSAPCFCVAGIGRDNDTYWPSEQEGAWDVMPTGKVHGWQSGLPLSDRSLDVLYVPTDTGSLINQGISPYYSPAYPDAARFTAPMTVPPASLDYLYSWFDFVHTMGGRELGCAIASADSTNLTNFATIQAGTSTKFDKCYLHPSMVGKFKPAAVAKMYHARRNIPGVRLSFVSQSTVA